MPTSLAQLAALVDGQVIGDNAHCVEGVAGLESATSNQISFMANGKYRGQLEATRAGCVIVSEPCPDAGFAQLVCDDPYLALAKIAAYFHPALQPPAGVCSGAQIHPDAQVSPEATVAMGAVVDAGATIGARSLIDATAYVGRGAKIGTDCSMRPGSRVLDGCVIGDRVTLQSGCVVGSDGFGYAPDSHGRRHKIPQVGIVVVEDDVEIGANTTIDRATFGETRVGRGTKIDNLVQIAHNVSLGKHCIIVSQSGVAGSTHVGDRVIMGAQSGVVGHITIPDGTILGARAGVAATIETAEIYSGTPAIPHRNWLKSMTALARLPKLRHRVRNLERRVLDVETEIADGDSKA